MSAALSARHARSGATSLPPPLTDKLTEVMHIVGNPPSLR